MMSVRVTFMFKLTQSAISEEESFQSVNGTGNIKHVKTQTKDETKWLHVDITVNS